MNDDEIEMAGTEDNNAAQRLMLAAEILARVALRLAKANTIDLDPQTLDKS